MAFVPDRIRDRGYLPHWESEGAIYSVTFRLGDSVPQSVLEGYLRERRDIVETAAYMERELTELERRRLEELFSEKIEGCLDRGMGACHLRVPEVGRMVFEAVHFFHGERYELYTWCVMPNHVHVLFAPTAPHTLTTIFHSWKSFTSHEANRMLGRRGEFWMEEYYDHLVQDEGEFWHAHGYILENPGKAGLKKWPWVGTLVEGRSG